MKLRSILAAGITALFAQTALAQPAPGAPPPPFAPPAASPAAPPGVPGAPSAAQFPAQPQPPAYPPGAYPYPPQGAYPPPGWGPPERPTYLRMEMPYDPDTGVPGGYKVTEKARTGLILAGATTLGGLWVVSAIAGGFMEDSGQYSGHHGWPMWIPVLGPFITIGTSGSDWAGTTVLVFDGIAQGAAAAALIAGLATSQKVLKYQFAPTAQVTLRPVAAPMQNGGFAGVSGSF